MELTARVYVAARRARDRFPALRTPLAVVNRLLGVQPPFIFSGWGMATQHALPWDSDPAWSDFSGLESRLSKLTHTAGTGLGPDTLAQYRWRHWVVALAARAAVELAPRTDSLALAECGVADGVSAFIALSEVSQRMAPRAAVMHLYDSWDRMNPDLLLPSEAGQAGRYDRLSLDVARSNLAEFGESCVFHIGYIPDSFDDEPASPDLISFLHVDLNSAIPTRAACEFFWPRLSPGGVMLFDDYGWFGFEDTRRAIDDFFLDKPGLLVKFPTGQAFFLRRAW